MLLLSLRNLWAHRRRLVGTVVAVVLGVAFLSGTLLLGDTLRANFDALFTQTTAGTDVVVRSATVIGDDQRQNRRPDLDATLVDTVAHVDGVADAQPYVTGSAQLLGRNGATIGGAGPPTRAANWITDPVLNPYRLVEGRAPEADDEVVVNRGAANTGGLHVGDTTTLLTPEPVTVRVVGIATFGSADGNGPSTFTGLTLHAAQQLLVPNPSRVTEIHVRGAAGTSPDQLAARIQQALPPGVETITGTQLAAESIADINSGFLGFVRGALTGFAVIALLVAALSIHNTFSIVVAQRTRESALLRALGASRRQIVVGELTETAIVGLVGAAVGWAAGVGIAIALKAMFDAFGFALPAGGLVFEPTSAIVAVLTGLAATLVAGTLPAIRSSRVAPIAALRDVAVEPAVPTRRRGVLGTVAVVVGVGLAVDGALGSRGTGFTIAGVVLTVVGAVALGPVIARPVAGAIGAPVAAWRGITGALSRQNARRNPRRTAATASALMIGVAVVAAFTVVGSSLKASATQGVDRSLTADLVIDRSGFGGRSGGSGFDPQLAKDAASAPGVEVATGFASGSVRLDGAVRGVTVVDAPAATKVVDFGVDDGSLSSMSASSLAVSDSAARARHWRVGTVVPIVYPDGTSSTLTVAAIYSHTDLVGDYTITASAWSSHATQLVDTQVFVRLAPGADAAATRAA